jgi:hypothetical protein
MLRLLSNPQLCALGVAVAVAAVGYAALAQPASSQPASQPASRPVAAQAYVWKHVKILAGGYLPNIVFSPAKAGLVYCRADIGGVYRSEDSGKTWRALLDWSGVSNEQGGESVAPDPVDPNTVYIAAGMYSRDTHTAIMRSTDGGKTFSVFSIPVTMGGNENGRGVGERLAVDPNSTNILYFGSRRHGLWVSTDSAQTWAKVDSFPVKGSDAAVTGRRGGSAGLSFVAFDPASGSSGKPSQTIYVASTEAGDAHFFRSTDAGKTWKPVPGQPAEYLPVRGQFDAAGNLYIVYNNSPGPGGATNGRFWKYNTKDGTWADISPDPATAASRPVGRERVAGGYGGFGLDRQRPGAILIATCNRIVGDDADQLYRTVDGGKTWANITAGMHRDMSATPYLPWVGTVDHNIGWWIDGLGIDPFDSNHAVYCTGATIYTTGDLTNADERQDTHWTTCVDGIEEVAVRGLVSPTAGAHLISVLYDEGGFTHDDLDASPPMQQTPMFCTGDCVDFAELNPKIVVRTGSKPFHFPFDGAMGYSLDGGHAWLAFAAPPAPATTAPARGRRGGDFVILSADGGTFMYLSAPPQISTDHGKTWAPVTGLPASLRPVADRKNPAKFYAVDTEASQVYASADGGKTFAAAPSAGLPTPAEIGLRADGGGWSTLQPTLGTEGDLWLYCRSGMYHSADGGAHFAHLPGSPVVSHMGFGMAAPGKAYPAIYVSGTLAGLTAIFRSDDAGATWLRINDDQHQYGTRFEAVTGDPRIYGRVYVGTNGRGILYADIAK